MTIQAMRRVSAYRTSDDQIHGDRVAAVRHQARIDLRNEIISATSLEPGDADILAGHLIDGGNSTIKLLRNAHKGL
jgi:hypothetical protein